MRELIKESAVIVAHNGPLNGANWCISGELTIGRDVNCDIVIADRQVSRVHAKIAISKTKDVVLTDFNSKNGTYVNGEMINLPVILKDGDQIKIALVQEFLYVSSDATLPLDSSRLSASQTAKRLFIEETARRVWIGDKELTPPLSVSQYALLLLLSQNEGKVVTREQIVDSVWGKEESIGVTEQAIDALVRRLRSRLMTYDPTVDYIITVRGVGYMMQNEKY